MKKDDCGKIRAENNVENLLAQESKEKEPDRIDIYRFFEVFRKQWKILLVLAAVCAILNALIHPATTTTVYGARATVYIPPYTTKEIDGHPVVVTNNVSQLPNAIGLIQTKVYQDKIAHDLGVAAISDAGSYQLHRKKDTDIVEINCQSSNQSKAAELCHAVLDTFDNETIQEASISEAVVVNPVTEYSNVTVTSTFRSLVMGALVGIAVYTFYCIFLFITDKKFHSKEEAEDVLGIPVLSVMQENRHIR